MKVGVQAAVSERLPVPVLLGTDVPELGHLLQKDPRAAHSEGVVEESSGSLEGGERSGEFPGDKKVFVEEKSLEGEMTKMSQVGAQSFAVMTRAQRQKQQSDDEEQLVKGLISDVQSSLLEEEGNRLEEFAEGESPVFGSQFSKDYFQQGRERCNVKTKRQRQEERHSHGLVWAKDRPKREESVSGRSLCVDREELCQIQRSDEKAWLECNEVLRRRKVLVSFGVRGCFCEDAVK